MSRGRQNYYDYNSKSNSLKDVTEEVVYENNTAIEAEIDTHVDAEDVKDYTKRVIVTTKILNVRTSPEIPEIGPFTNIKTRVNSGTKLDVIEEIGDWYKIKLSDNSINYVLKEFTSEIVK